MRCDNIRACHTPRIINDNDAIVAICETCKEFGIFRMDRQGRPDNKEYSKFFRRDILQAESNLYYKYHPEKMSIL